MAQRGKKTGPEKRRKKGEAGKLTARLDAERRLTRRTTEVRKARPEDLERLAKARAEKLARGGVHLLRNNYVQ